MSASKEFYVGSLGDRLIDEANYPAAIQEFVSAEDAMLASSCGEVDLIVEVGCMEGRYAERALSLGKRYLGVDPVARYVDAAAAIAAERKWPASRCAYAVGRAEDLLSLLHDERATNAACNILVFFPFNSIGNMDDLLAVAEVLAALEAPFLISSYLTSEQATAARSEYYRRCSFVGLSRTDTPDAVCFSSQDGLRTFAYHPEHVQKTFSSLGVRVAKVEFSSIGVAYHGFRVEVGDVSSYGRGRRGL